MSFSNTHKTYLLFLVLTFIFYGNSIKNEYAIDDVLVADNPIVKKGIKALPELFTTSYYADKSNRFGYRPVAKSTFAIEYSLFGTNPHVSHLINLLLYWMAVCLSFKMLNQLLGPSHSFFSTIVSVLFLIHPIHTEVVCSLKNRETILSFIGSIAAMLFYGKYILSNKIKYILYGAASLLFAYASKEDSMVFLFIIPFSLHYFKNASSGQFWRIIASYLIPFGILQLLVFYFRIGLDEKRVYEYFENPLYFDSTIWNRSSMGFYTLAYYIRLLFVPYPLIVYYGYSQVSIHEWNSWIVILSAILTITTLIYCFFQYKKRSPLVYGILFFIAGISMFLNAVIPVTGIIGERYAFMASIGFCIVISAGLFKLFKIDTSEKIFLNKKWVLLSISVLAMICFGIVFKRNPQWQDTYTLAKADAFHAPNSVKIHDLLADLSLKKYNESRISKEEKEMLIKQATSNYQESLNIYPNQASVVNNLGLVTAGAYNNYKDAIPYFTKAIEIDSTLSQSYYNLGVCYNRSMNIGDAELNFKRAIHFNPAHMQAYFDLTGLYINMNKIDEGIKLNMDGIKAGTKYPDLYLNLGDLYIIKKDSANAISYYEQSLSLRPKNKKLCLMLEEYYSKKNDAAKSSLYKKMAEESE